MLAIVINRVDRSLSSNPQDSLDQRKHSNETVYCIIKHAHTNTSPPSCTGTAPPTKLGMVATNRPMVPQQKPHHKPRDYDRGCPPPSFSRARQPFRMPRWAGRFRGGVQLEPGPDPAFISTKKKRRKIFPSQREIADCHQGSLYRAVRRQQKTAPSLRLGASQAAD